MRNQPSLLLNFLRQMPKGGDLHNHLIGAVYAESFIRYAAEDGLCVDHNALALVPGSAEAAGGSDGASPQCDGARDQVPARQALSDPVLYRNLVDALSMRHFVPSSSRSGHDHFFDTFGRFFPATRSRLGDMLAEVVSRAADSRAQYLELTLSPDNNQAGDLGAGISWTGNLEEMERVLRDRGVEKMAATSRKNLDAGEEKMRSLLRCGSPQADPGCAVTLRYQFEVHRALSPAQVFGEMLVGMELASSDPRVLAVNLVMPEDAYVPMRDFRLHMTMLEYLRRRYPRVRISLHAGELAPGLVPPSGLRFHIRESIERGGAERIGHGVDVMYENDPIALLKEMARRGVLVEICLTSNEAILGVRGADHPLPMYLAYGVPVSLATDDEGVSRSDLVQEYLRAVRDYRLSYAQLKKMVRAAVEHSFLPGENLWAKPGVPWPAAACAGDDPARYRSSPACRKFLDGSERARLQWRVERELASFEQAILKQSMRP